MVPHRMGKKQLSGRSNDSVDSLGCDPLPPLLTNGFSLFLSVLSSDPLRKQNTVESEPGLYVPVYSVPFT